MYNLLISATENVVVRLYEVKNKNVKLVRANEKENGTKAEDILKLVKYVLGDKSIDDVSKIFINVGPGSFTGIRASLSLVFGLVFGKKKIEIVPFTSFDAIAYNTVSSNSRYLVVTGFGNLVYAREQMREKEVCSKCVSFDDLANDCKMNFGVVIASTPELLKQFQRRNLNTVLGIIDFEIVIKKHIQGKLQEIEPVPVYLRASQAEIQRMEKINNGKK